MIKQRLVQWHILNIGCLSRNRFWREDESLAHRHAVCTSTLLYTGDRIVVVDPSLPPEQMALVLDARYGITHDDVDMVFITHFHGDHYIGLESFKRADWFMGADEFDTLKPIADRREYNILERISPVNKELTPEVELMHLPGHTKGLTGLSFSTPEGLVVLASDAIMTRDFFIARQGYFNNVNQTDTAASILKAAGVADIIIPGHDNYFIVKAMEALEMPQARKANAANFQP